MRYANDKLYAHIREPKTIALSVNVSKKEKDTADLIREYQRRLGHVSIEQLAQISRRKPPPALQHESNRILGSDPAQIKGKNKRSKVSPTPLAHTSEQERNVYQSLEVDIINSSRSRLS
jgi:hypothetical protein